MAVFATFEKFPFLKDVRLEITSPRVQHVQHAQHVETFRRDYLRLRYAWTQISRKGT